MALGTVGEIRLKIIEYLGLCFCTWVEVLVEDLQPGRAERFCHLDGDDMVPREGELRQEHWKDPPKGALQELGSHFTGNEVAAEQ